MNADQLIAELTYRTARSGGKGGQNVNKVETKVEARFEVAVSMALTDEEKTTIMEKLADQISAEGFLSAVNQTERSQLANKHLAEQKLLRIVQKALIKPKPRRATRVPAGVVAARSRDKQWQSDRKSARKKPSTGESREDED